VTPPATGPTAVDPATWWAVDSYRQGGHTVAEAIAFMSYLDDEGAEQARRRRAPSVNVASPDLGRWRRRGGLRGWLKGW